MKQSIEEQFEIIVRTLLSSQPVQSRIIREHLNRYAQDAGIPYDLAKQAAILVVKGRLQKKLAEL